MTRKHIVVIVASIAIIISTASIIQRLRPIKTAYKPDVFAGIGQALADETDKALNGQGNIVVLITKSYHQPHTPLHDELKAFQTELQTHRGLSVAALVELQDNTLETGYWQDQFGQLVNQYDNASAIVSLVGLPNLDSQTPLKFENNAPKIIAVYQSATTPAKDYFTHSVVTVLIASRANPDPNAAAQPKTSREWFNKFYEVYTTNNFDSLPQ